MLGCIHKNLTSVPIVNAVLGNSKLVTIVVNAVVSYVVVVAVWKKIVLMDQQLHVFAEGVVFVAHLHRPQHLVGHPTLNNQRMVR